MQGRPPSASVPAADIEDDQRYVRMFMDNIEENTGSIEVVEVEPWPSD